MAAVGALALPGSALAAVDPLSLTTEAEIVATAFDGGGGSEVRKPVFRAGFRDFVFSRTSRDSNADSGRSARGEASQVTKVVEEGDEFLGIDSSGSGLGRFTNPETNDGEEPAGTGLSDLTIQFEVVDDPVKFVLTGDMAGSATPDTGGVLGTVNVVSPSGVNHTVASGESEEIDERGELQPGVHTLSIELRAEAFNDGINSGVATADYDIELRFCTVVVEEPGEAALGTSGDDVICGRAGDEQLLGVGGNDIMFGFGGADDIDGAGGADQIFGGEGDDNHLYGGPGNDIILGGPGNDGGTGFDSTSFLAGGPGDDEINGGPGSDRLAGRCLEGVLGNPSPICQFDPQTPGESDDDNLTGGPGADQLAGDKGHNLINGGPGDDIAVADGPSVFLLGGGDDSAIGSGGTDEMEGAAGKDDLEGTGGADCLVGGGSADRLKGGQGNDKLIARDGTRDRVNGGPAPDRGRFDSNDQVVSVSQRNLSGGC